MKRITCLVLFVITTIVIANASGTSPIKNKAAEPSAILQKMWIVYDATENGRPGMMMHVAFTVYNMKNITGFMNIYFKYTDGQPNSFVGDTITKDQYHTIPSGILFTKTPIRPINEVTVYDDVESFIPYDEFKLDPGEHELTINVFIVSKAATTIALLKQYDILFTETDDSRSANKQVAVVKSRPIPTTGPRATFDSLWVEFDVKESEQLGMRIHFKFVAFDMKDTQSSVAIYFLYNTTGGGTLKDKNQKFLSGSGDVAVYLDITPGFTTAYFDDLPVFMPYAELDLAPGNYHLLMDTKLIYRQGGLISNFVYQGFSYIEASR